MYNRTARDSTNALQDAAAGNASIGEGAGPSHMRLPQNITQPTANQSLSLAGDLTAVDAATLIAEESLTATPAKAGTATGVGANALTTAAAAAAATAAADSGKAIIHAPGTTTAATAATANAAAAPEGGDAGVHAAKTGKQTPGPTTGPGVGSPEPTTAPDAVTVAAVTAATSVVADKNNATMLVTAGMAEGADANGTGAAAAAVVAAGTSSTAPPESTAAAAAGNAAETTPRRRGLQQQAAATPLSMVEGKSFVCCRFKEASVPALTAAGCCCSNAHTSSTIGPSIA